MCKVLWMSRLVYELDVFDNVYEIFVIFVICELHGCESDVFVIYI
jgi:hypothetical protein